MVTEFDDLFSTAEIAHSRRMSRGRTTLSESEEILDRILGSKFSSVPVHKTPASITWPTRDAHNLQPQVFLSEQLRSARVGALKKCLTGTTLSERRFFAINPESRP